MRRMLAGSLGLSFLLAFGSQSIRADDIVWRAASHSSGQAPASVSLGRPVALGRPIPVDATQQRVLLTRPVPLQDVESVQAAPIVDQHVRPTAFSDAWGVTPRRRIVRAQSGDAQPMPQGPVMSKPVLWQSAAQKQTPDGLHTIASSQPEGPELLSPPKPVSPAAPNTTIVPGAGPAPVASGSQLFYDTMPGCGCDAGGGTCVDGVSCDTSSCGGLCCDDACGCCDQCGRLWVRAEYLMWSTKNSHMPPLVSTSLLTSSLGVLGTPTTSVLYGDSVKQDLRHGGRFSVGFWADPDQSWGIESNYFFLGQRSVNFTGASFGGPILARPFVNALTGLEAVEQVANPADPARGILPQTGIVGVTNQSHLWGTEIDGLCNICQDCRHRFDFVWGFRYLELQESLNIGENLMTPVGAGVGLAGVGFALRDEFGAKNQMYVQQWGLKWRWMFAECWSLDVAAKCGIGVNHQVVSIDGSTITTVPGAAPVTTAGGLLAQPTNIGRRTQDKFVAIPEVGITLGWQIAPRWRLLLGYNVLYANNVVRPGDQIDRVVNPTQLTGSPTGGVLMGPARPTFAFRTTDFWAQGATVGLEFKY